MIKDSLKSVGMTNNEIEIYLTLLESSELSVNEIAKGSGIHRQVCYDALDRLSEKGFVSYFTKNEKKYYRCLHPKKILDYLEEKKNQMTEILPTLFSLFNGEDEETNIELLKGKRVLRMICNDIVNTLKETKGTMYAMGIDEEKFLSFDEIAISQYVTKLKKYGLKEKLLSKVSGTSFFEGSQSEYRLLPDHLFNPNPTQIYGDKIAIIIWGRPTYGIIIENKQVADANKKYFQILWSIAKKRSAKKKKKK